MNKKFFKSAGIIAALLTVASLALPVYHTYVDGGEGCFFTLRGFNLIEFSLWGVLVILIPVIMATVGCMKLSRAVKSGILGALLILGVLSLYLANRAMNDWICGIATGSIETYKSLFVYAGLFIAETAFFTLTIPKRQ